MDRDVAIRVEGLGKRYHVGERRERYRTLRDTIADAARAPARAVASLRSGRRAPAGLSSRRRWTAVAAASTRASDSVRRR